MVAVNQQDPGTTILPKKASPTMPQTATTHRRAGSGPQIQIFQPTTASEMKQTETEQSSGLESANVVISPEANQKKNIPPVDTNVTDFVSDPELSLKNLQIQTNLTVKPQHLFTQRREGSLLSKLQPMARSEDSQLNFNESERNSMDTLNTQIGIEEQTNVKIIGVSGTKPKGIHGSLTERQAQLLLFSSSTNSIVSPSTRQVNLQSQLETSVNHGPTLNRKIEMSIGPSTGTLATNNRHFEDPQQDLASTTRVLQGGFRGPEPSNSINSVNTTKVSPFQSNVLILNDKQLTNADITSYLNKHNALDKIDIAQNKITFVPYPDLLNFSTTLTQLCLESNKICEISEEALRQVPCLQLLKLRANQLTKLPDSLFSLAGLRVLDVSSNKITTFSPKVSLLRQLRLLNIAENQLKGLPNSIGYLASLESMTSEFFIYLPDYNDRPNNQIPFALSQQTLTSPGSGMIDPQIDWFTKFNRRMTIMCNGPDARFSKLMNFMRQQSNLISSLIDLIHEFQHANDGEYRMLETEDVIIETEGSDAHLPVRAIPSFTKQTAGQQSSEIEEEIQQLTQRMTFSCSPMQRLTSASLKVYSRYLALHEYNKLVTVFRMLSPDSNFGKSQTLLHFLVESGHQHLLTQFYEWIQATISASMDSLSAPTKQTPSALVSCLQVCFINKLRQALNQVNENGFNTLDIVARSKSVEMAEKFLNLFGPHIELECLQQKSSQLLGGLGLLLNSSRSEVAQQIIIPGNMQSGGGSDLERQPVSSHGGLPRQKHHPIVIALTGGKFQLAGKLIDVAFDFHLRKIQQVQDKEKHSRMVFDLNGCDREGGMTFLHHVFSNFETSPCKASNLFRKMNSLHLREQLKNNNGRGSISARLNSKSHTNLRLAACQSSQAMPSKMRKMQISSPLARDMLLRQHGSPLRVTSPTRHASPLPAPTQGDAPYCKIKPLQLNAQNNYYENPFELAIESFQNSAVHFALTWNFNHIQTIKHAWLTNQSSFNGSQSPRSMLYSQKKPKKPHQKSSDYFNLMSKENPREYTALHRAVIAGNFNAIKMLLDSPLFFEAHLFKQFLTKECQDLTLLDIHAMDKSGKTARDYSHKIVFMSKLLYQAYSKQVWVQAKLHRVKANLQKQASKPIIEERQSKITNSKSSLLATYDKLIAHSSQVRRSNSKRSLLENTLQSSQAFAIGLLSPQLTLRHSMLNIVFMRRQVSKNNNSLKMHEKLGLGRLQLQGLMTARSHGKRLVRSFANINDGSSPMNVMQTPNHERGVGIQRQPVMTPKGLAERGTGSITRQSIPQSTSGVRLGKTLAFSTIESRQFEGKPRYRPMGHRPPLGISLEVPEKSSLFIHRSPNNGDVNVQNTVATQNSRPAQVLETDNAPLYEETLPEPEQDSIDSIELIEDNEANAGVDVPLNLALRLNQVPKSNNSPRTSERSIYALAKGKIYLNNNSAPKFPSSQLNVEMKRRQLNNAIVNQRDVLKLADLESGKKPGTSRMDLTHEFNDSCSATSFTPLPSIQNDYALETKSFANQLRAPYSQQLATNSFREQFAEIMDSNCDLLGEELEHLLQFQSRPNSTVNRAREQEVKDQCKSAVKPLAAHQKIRILFEIVREANQQESKIQDAKDVLDFIQFEINQQATNKNSYTSKRKDPGQPKQPSGDITPNALQLSKSENLLQKCCLQLPVGPLVVNLQFLKQEVKDLRCQLDFLAKHQHFSAYMPAQHSQVWPLDDNEVVSGQDVLSSRVHTTQMDERTDFRRFENLSEAQQDDKKIQSCRNSNLANLLAGGSTKTANEFINVSHLTEADQEVSDDFDENQNSMSNRDSLQKKKTSVVEPYEVLERAKMQNFLSRSQQQSSKLFTPGLARLLGKLEKPQKMHISKQRRSLQDFDPDSQRSKSRENLETDEGQTVINQPLISAETQSFTDRLSQRKASGISNLLGNSATSRAGVDSLSNKKKAAYVYQKSKQVSHIDLTTRKMESSSKSKYALGDKSRSVVDFPKGLSTLTREGTHVRSFTRMLELQAPMQLNGGMIVEVEKQTQPHPRIHQPLQNSRVNSYKQIQTARVQTTAQAPMIKKKPAKQISAKKGQTSTLSSLTSQKIGLKVLHKYQKARSRAPALGTASGGAFAGAYAKPAQQVLSQRPAAKVGSLNVLTARAIALPSQSHKH